MNKILLIGLSMLLCFACFTSCDDWTEVESKTLETGDGKSPEYYENLRKWKAETQHDMAFGWFGFWSGEGTSLGNSMIGLPDSVHVISLWGPWLPHTMTEAKKKDLKTFQTLKGSKVMVCMFMEYVGQGLTSKNAEGRASWGWTWEHASSGCKKCVSTDPEERALQVAAIEKYAEAIADSLKRGGYDGLDIDYEPQSHNAAELVSHPENTEVLVRAFSKHFGPKSPNPGTLLAVDGQVEKLTAATIPYLDYLLYQAYSTPSAYSLNSFATAISKKYTTETMTTEEVLKKLFVTVNFESYSATGGGAFSMTGEDGKTISVNRLEGFARWQPVVDGETYRKGGYGAYHIEKEYTISGKSGFYPWTRNAIRWVHPPQE
ncbi:glycoside hydrolase family 18 [Dysgonomonas sp. 511]|uniref:glycoside hydrolase family 18 n=1 Tax=Dysgonomonas sp. 511 TaxID=2302930 RepID=UPI0013D4E6EF|nr:glycoside hydrolase family 18 [Dysgonomonas sp. 511]NDV79316.1 hypothetical protein [Dysgonomonas sp. 511]